MNTVSSPTRPILLLEIIGFVVLSLIGKMVLTQFIWKFAGPISLISLLLILTVYLRFRGERWSDFGLRSLRGFKPKLLLIPQILLTCGAFAAVVGSILFMSDKLGLEFMLETPDGVEERWGNVEGNLKMYLLWMGIVWVSAAFGEEMFFRGYLVTRLSQLFAGNAFGPVLAVLFAATLFGFGHVYYQGLRGFIMTAAIAIAFGTMFLLFKRNLWPIILVHGLIDSINFTVLYLGLE